MFYWTVHLHGGPKGYRHAAVSVGHEVYTFGGYGYNEAGIGVQIFNTVSLRWMKLPPATSRRGGEGPLEIPPMCWGHTAVLIEYVIYIWGGLPYCNVLYAFDVDTRSWFQPKILGTVVPEATFNHSACVLGKVMYIYGGKKLTGYTNDIYKLDTATMVWSLINTKDTKDTPLLASSCHSATIIGTKMFVFGGKGFYHNNTRVFDTENNCWLSMPSAQLLPERRDAHSAFAYNGELYIFGGEHCDQFGGNHRVFNDLWKLNPETFSWKKVEPKGKDPFLMTGMCCCTVGDRIILFGEDDKPDDLYMLDLSPSLATLCKLAIIQYGLKL